MRIPRIYHSGALSPHQTIQLDPDAANHIGRVLRLSNGHPVVLFNGDGNNYSSLLVEVSKKRVTASIEQATANHNESPLHIHLGQVISRGDRMEITLQKSVELGVTTITPLFSERCGVKLNAERLEKKRQQWQKIVISACEQCGRSVVPEIAPVEQLEHWLQQDSDALQLTLDPCATLSLATLSAPEKNSVRLLIGPEGGLTSSEVESSYHHDFTPVTLGPRILRTETAALTVISILQSRFGDLS